MITTLVSEEKSRWQGTLTLILTMDGVASHCTAKKIKREDLGAHYNTHCGENTFHP